MRLRSKVHLWWTWLQIAVRNAAGAQNARSNGYVLRAFESSDSTRLSAEFQFALTAIAAVAFAMEALKKEVEAAGHKMDCTLFTKPAKANKGFFVGHRIVQAFGLTGRPAAAGLPERMDALFELRNNGVHFESEWRAGGHPHPSGTSAAYELTVYTLEAAIKAVQLGVDVVRECAAAASAKSHDVSASDAANEMHGVLEMLKAEVETAGLRGLV